MKRMIDSELIEALGTDIKFDGTGNVIVGNNLEVDGTTKLSGGLEVLYSYDFKDNISTRLDVVFARHNHFSGTWDDYIGYGYISQFGTRHPCIFSYSTNNGTIESFNAISEYKIYTLDENKKVARYDIAKAEKCQTKLYRHIITMVANTEEGDPETSIIEYISTNNLKVDNLEKLTTLLKPTANFIYPLGPVVNADLGGITDYNQLEYSNSVWKFAGSASNTTKINVASVSDVVTAL